MPKFQRVIHLRFHFAGTTNSSDEPYDPKMYVRSNWTPHTHTHIQKMNWKTEPPPISDTRPATTTTTTRFPHLPLR